MLETETQPLTTALCDEIINDVVASAVSSAGDESPHRHRDCNPIEIKVYKRRFWILVIFSLLSCFQCVQWNTWGPISQSMEAAFPGWSSRTIATLSGWGTLCYVIFVFPLCLLVSRKSVRLGVCLGAALVFVGTVLRCLPLDISNFTLLCHAAAILVGIAGPIMLSTAPVLAALWFPPHERTSAMAFCQASSQLGIAFSYLEVFVVHSPAKAKADLGDIHQDVSRLMNIWAITSSVLLLGILSYFPNKPPLPPSMTSSVERFSFLTAVKGMFSHKKMVLILISYSVFSGIPAGWLSVLNYSLIDFGIDQDEAMRVALIGVCTSSVSVLVVARFTDRFYGHVKTSLLVLIALSFFSFLWFMLLSLGILQPVRWQVYCSVILAISFSYASTPLFYELSVESAYPSPEFVVGGVISCGNNFVALIFLLLFQVPFQGYSWVTYCLVGGTFLSLIFMLFVEQDLQRSNLDREYNRSISIAQRIAGMQHQAIRF